VYASFADSTKNRGRKCRPFLSWCPLHSERDSSLARFTICFRNLRRTTFSAIRIWLESCTLVSFLEIEMKLERRCSMLWTIFVVLLILWMLGMATSYTLGGFIHILLLLAIATVLIRVIQGRDPI
jgi:uncharacterized protein DUF5670